MSQNTAKTLPGRKAAGALKCDEEQALAAESRRPASPCTEICTLDDDNVCVGCYRTLDEIVAWATLAPAEQWAVVDAVSARKASRAG